MTYVGIDVSKATFVVAYSSAKGSRTNSFKNTIKGIHEFIQTISVAEHHCVLEATGNYSSLLVYLLSQAGIAVSLENPLKIKNFARVMLSVTKTDEIDARLIAMYGEKMQPAPYKLRSDTILTLKQKRTVIRQLKKQLIATSNLKGSMEALPFFDPKCKKAIEKTITFLEKQIKNLEEELAVLAQSEYKKQMDLLTSIKGIGVTLAAALIMATGGFTYFDNAKQLTRYLGLSPTYQQSGTSVNVKGHINRNGDSSLRSQLYVAAFASLRCNTECKACFDRLRSKGKPGKVALIAVANKLVRQAFAIVTQEKTYVDGFKSAKP
ncbi:IS110 family transposase [Bacteroides heparinolyticus]|uniref:IS110 family transposase n=1 Tax=Prevotella heparinolytica TaxID=28113 RepID=UPI0023F8C49C|nr:IS110 family transposase [Bacteroides heparinolyticus]MCI6211854.1 IS110 family transposase [Bacteroides heparinolyticus]